jgi:hypothetical protein
MKLNLPTIELEELVPVDVLDERESWISLESHMALLQEQYEEIARVGGVTRAQARTLVSECAVVFPERYSPESFTELPSKTNLAITQETIGETAVKLLVDLVKAAIALLMKIVAWIRAMITKAVDRMRGLDKVKTNTEVLSLGTQHLKQALGDTITLSGEPLKQWEDLHKDMDLVSLEYVERYTALFNDVIHNGPMAKYLRAMMVLIPHVVDDISERLTLLDAVGRMNYPKGISNSEIEDFVTNAKHAAQPINASSYIEMARKMGVTSNLRTFADVVNGLKTQSFKLTSNTDTGGESLVDVIKILLEKNADSANFAIFLNKERLEKQTAVIGKKLAELEHLTISTDPGQRVARAYTDAFNSINEEFTAVSNLMGLATYMDDIHCQVYIWAERYAEAEYRTWLIAANAAGDDKLRVEVSDIHKSVLSKLKRM